MQTPEAVFQHAPVTGQDAASEAVKLLPAAGWRAVFEDGDARPLVAWRFVGSRGVGIVLNEAGETVVATELPGFKRYLYQRGGV